MTIAVHFVTVARSISNLSIAGINVRDLDEIPVDASKILPVLFPIPNGFITDVVPERMTMGGGGTAKIDLSYTMNYRFLKSIAGANLENLSIYSDLIEDLAAITVAILGNDDITGAVDMELQGVSNMGPLTDPAGTGAYIGLDIALRVLEFAQ